MGITVGHDPTMGSLLNMSYLAGLGSFNRWNAEYQQRSDLANAQMGTQASIATAGNQTRGDLGQDNIYAKQMQNQYNNDMKMQLAQLRAQLAGQNQMNVVNARNPFVNAPGGAGDVMPPGPVAAPPAPPPAAAPAPSDTGGGDITLPGEW